MKNTILCLIVLTNLSVAFGQQNVGIKFENKLTWSQIQSKAKAERKYIFVDCYATWCGPCKEMDKNVYPHKKVGDIFNAQFVSVKLQFDRTSVDDEDTKNRYGTVTTLQRNYTVHSYPTFLFFDSDGRPVHKASGACSVDDFIKLASDAQTPDKQYYSVLKNFQPGKLDTSELKELSRSFAGSNQVLAGELAYDYLRRISFDQLELKDNEDLIAQFQDNPQIIQIVTSQINQSDKIRISSEENLIFLTRLYKSKQIQQLVKAYIDHLSNDSLYTNKIIHLLKYFTNTSSDRGFDLFYNHADTIDVIMKDQNFAEDIIEAVIDRTVASPFLTIAKEKEQEPDWQELSTVIKKKYNSFFASRIIIDKKYDWYRYLVKIKKEEKYWPDLIKSSIDLIDFFRYDTTKSRFEAVNEVAWNIFLHSNDEKQINTGINWMKNIVSDFYKYSPSHYYMDTYACLLYKAGQLNDALKWEQRAVQVVNEQKNTSQANLYNATIEKMKDGKKLWLEYK